QRIFMPMRGNSLASDLVSRVMAPFDAQYAEWIGPATLPNIDDTLTIELPAVCSPARLSRGSSVWQPMNTPSTLTASVLRRSVSVVIGKGTCSMMPALLTSASISPSSDSMASFTRCQSVSEVTSCASVNGRLQVRSEEHRSELQSRESLVCRLQLAKNKAAL